MPRILAILLSLTGVALLACGTSATQGPPTEIPSAAQPAESSSAQSTATPTAEDSAAAAPEASLKVQPAVGTDVGKTVPHFEFTLSEGTKQSTAQLASQGKPVFLFFFATW